MEVKVIHFENDWWPGKNTKYTAQIENVEIKEKKIVKFIGSHEENKTDDDVLGIRFDDCAMDFVPSGFCQIYKNLTILLVFNSDIRKLTMDDFEGCGQLKEIWFNGIKVEYLPGNLLNHMPDLEIVSIQSSMVKYIDTEILDDLPKLKVAKFNKNDGIDAFYDSVSNTGVSLEELKEKIKAAQPPPDYPVYIRINKDLLSDMNNFIRIEKYKDFTISVGDEDFKVHKFILASRSTILADMIYNNPSAVTLKLADMKKEIFKDVLNYIYHDKLMDINTNAFEIFSAACRFGLEKLKIHAIRNMTAQITPDNALEMLFYGNGFKNEKLTKKAFEEIKKMIPGRQISEELIDKPEKVKLILNAKKAMDEKIKAAQEEFEKLLNE